MKKILYRGDFSSVSGYSRASRSQARALIEAGVDIQIENHRKGDPGAALDGFWVKELGERLGGQAFDVRNYRQDRRDFDVVIWHETPNFYAPDPDQKNIGCFAWETSKLPSVDLRGDPRNNWVAQLNRMDEIWVPCAWNQAVCVASGVTKPVRVVPHPIRLEDYPLETKPMFPKEEGKPTLLSVFEWQPRKDPLSLLLGVYLSKVPVRLLVKTRADAPGRQVEIVRYMKGVKESFHVRPESVVVPIFENIPDAEMPALYASCDAYVTTTHGEGFCLPAVEAMAMGKPVIAPAGTGLADYMTPDDRGFSPSFPVSLSWEPVFGMGAGSWYSPDQQWMKVSPQSVARRIEEAMDDDLFSGANRRAFYGVHARAEANLRFASEKIGARMKELLEAL